MKPQVHPFWIAKEIALCCLFTTSAAQAQIASDGTLSTEVKTTDNLNFTITNGNLAGKNLFHSFSDFSVPTGGSAFFDNAPDIQNIISRVTGSSVSNIDGLLQAKGTANLFLLNPNGIIFGPNASLNIGGSFLASTASSLNFGDGNQFSATAPQPTPLLSINVPIGLQFGRTAAPILVQGSALEVRPGKTLGLVGGDVTLKAGYLGAGKPLAEGGRIELGSVAGNSLVSLNPTEKGWALGYGYVQNFQNIQLTQGTVDGHEFPSVVNADGEGGGDIQVQGRRVILTDGSQLKATTWGSEPGGTLAVAASDTVELSGTSPNGANSGLFTITFAAGKAGDVTVNTNKLAVQNGAAISTEAELKANGRGGNLTILAPDSVELIDGSLYTRTFGVGNAGDLTLNTGRLLVRDGAQVIAATFGQGDAGDIQIDASDSVRVASFSSSTGRSSGLFTSTVASGRGGNLTVNTSAFQVADGAVLNAQTTANGEGGNITVNAKTFEAIGGGQLLTTTEGSKRAGNITLNVADSITISGSDPTSALRVAQFGRTVIDNEGPASGLFANTAQGSTGSGGDVTIKTRQLNVNDGARVTVSSLGTGKAGNLIIDPDLVKLDRGTLTAETQSGEGGNITIFGGSIQLGNNSRISTKARGNGNGGNININADTLVGLENSDIVANAYAGNGGKVKITTQGIFGFQLAKKETPLTSDITASSELGINGVVQINTPDVDPSLGIVTLPVELVDVTGLIAQRCPAGGGNVARGSSEFIVTGRGGLPPNTREALASEPALADLGTPVPSQEHRASAAISTNPISSEPAPIVAATGWVIGDNGQVVLTAQAPTVTPDIPWLKPTTCHAS